MGEFPHFYPLCPTSVSIIRGVPVKINPFSVKVFDAEPFLTVSKHVSQPVEKDKKTFARPDVRRAGKYLYSAKGNFVCEVREIALLCAGKEN